MSVSRVYAYVLENKAPEYSNYEDMEIKWESPKRYQIIEKVGRGKYSEVFKAMDMETKEYVSIKYLKPVRKKKIRREIKIMQNLSQGPYVIPLLAVTKDPETHQPSLITKWVETKDFREYYPSLSDYEFRAYMYKILVGLDYAHSMGVIHRDIKPHNILIDYLTKEVFIIDWGLAEFYHPHDRYNVRVSTRHYKGPELLTNDVEYDYSLDIWSLSCMIAGIIFDRTPFFRGKDNFEQLEKIAEVMGTDELDRYIAKYRLKLDAETVALLHKHERRPWADFVPKNDKFINQDVFDFLDKTLVYDHDARLTARECMAHKWFDPVREQVENEVRLKKQQTSISDQLTTSSIRLNKSEELYLENVNYSLERRLYSHGSYYMNVLQRIKEMSAMLKQQPSLKSIEHIDAELSRISYDVSQFEDQARRDGAYIMQ